MCTFSFIQSEASSHVTVSAPSFCSILITRMVGILLQREHSVSLVRETPRLSRARLPWWHACIVVDLFCLSLSQCESAGHSVKQQSWMSHCTRDTVGLINSIRTERTHTHKDISYSMFTYLSSVDAKGNPYLNLDRHYTMQNADFPTFQNVLNDTANITQIDNITWRIS